MMGEREVFKEKNFKIKKAISSSQILNPLLLTIDCRPLTKDELDGCDNSAAWYEGNQSTRLIKLPTGIDNGVKYQGTTQIKGDMCKLMLVLQNKKTNKIQLVEVNECQLRRALPQPNWQTNYDNNEIQSTYQENKAKLLKAFGSKKATRLSDVGSRLQVNSQLMASQMKNSAADVKVDLKELQMADSLVDSCLPPMHRNATDSSSVFLLEDFLTEAELNAMEDEAFTILHLMPLTTEESGYSQFLIDSLDRLQNKVSPERIKVLLYIDALVKFLQIPDLHKKRKKEIIEKTSPFSGLLGKKMIEHFSVDGPYGRVRNPTMDDKVVIHIVILVIIACGSCNVEELTKYLPKYSVSKLGQITRAVGLSTVNKIQWFVRLPLPPLKPKILRKRKR